MYRSAYAVHRSFSVKFTIEMVAARLPDLLAASRRERLPLAPARIALAPLPGAHSPAYDDSHWDALHIGDRWGGSGLTYWLRIPLRIPDAWADQPAVVHIALGDYDNITGPEALAYLDGEPIQAFDFYHRHLLISDRLRPGNRSPAGAGSVQLPHAGAANPACP